MWCLESAPHETSSAVVFELMGQAFLQPAPPLDLDGGLSL